MIALGLSSRAVPEALVAVARADHPVARVARGSPRSSSITFGIVVDRQDQPAAAGAAPRVRVRLAVGGAGSGRRGASSARGQRAPRGAAAAVSVKVEPTPERALERDVAAQEAREPAADRQAEAGAAVLPGAAAVDLAELLEHQLALALPGMPMPVSATASATSSPLAPRAHRDRARLGELGGVAEQVDQDLAQLVLIAEQASAGPARSP